MSKRDGMDKSALHKRLEQHSLQAFIMQALEVVLLVSVPIALFGCAALQIEAAAGLTLFIAVVGVAGMMANYEASRPALRQLMPTVVLGAVAAAGRVLFAVVPDVKPVSAIAIVAGACLGRRNGFMVGALAALVSNMFFGQGPWTPWQMYAWGLIGYLSGVLSQKGVIRSCRSACVFGFLSGLLYGLILNGWYIVGYVHPLTLPGALAALLAGLPLDLVHAIATVVFLALIWKPWTTRIRRVVRSYGLV